MRPVERLRKALEDAVDDVGRAADRMSAGLQVEERGTLRSVGMGTAVAGGLPGAGAEELVRLGAGRMGMVFNLDPNEVGIVLLDDAEGLHAGSEVRRTGRVLDVPVGGKLLGRILDALGRPLDRQGAVSSSQRLSVEREAPPIMNRAPVTVPLQTGIKAVDALVPIGRGQRELILGDRQTGKTAIALDAILNQRETGVKCVYCAIGQRSAGLSKVIAEMRESKALEYTILVATTEDDAPGLRFVAPYSAMSMAEHFRDRGEDVLVVFDDLTRHARAYREVSLLLRRPPGREAYPGDIFYIHSRLLERSTHLREEHGGGSLTALPVIETEAQNISAYVPTNLISITDGQIYLSPGLFQKGVLPAVDVGKSVSRVGGKTQLPAYRAVAGDLRLAYSQFEELESFARFGTRMDEETRSKLERGRRVREILKQPSSSPMPVDEQIAALLAVTEGLLDEVEQEKVGEMERAIREAVSREEPELCERIREGEKLEEEAHRTLVDRIRKVVEAGGAKGNHGNP
jgi:F-type H+-transporting ATPase subunit alpha